MPYQTTSNEVTELVIGALDSYRSKGANFAFKIIKKYTEINLYTKIKQNDTLIKKESFATP